MKQAIITFIMLSLFVLSVQAQEKDIPINEQEFFKILETSYYTIKDTPLENFTVLVNNVNSEIFASEHWKNAEIFPLQLIWFSNSKLFLADQGIRQLPNDSLKTEYSEMVADLKTQLTGVLSDLTTFYLVGINGSISPDYQLRQNNQLVEVKFLNASSIDDTSYHTYYFGLNGLCLKQVTEIPSQDMKIEIYPNFKIVKTKWLITDWEAQISVNNEIQSGLVIGMNTKFVNDVWIPEEISMVVQRADSPGKTFTDKIKFRNFLFNQPLQFINSGK